MKNNKYVEYCSACGLCQAKGYADFSYKKGFLTPDIKTDDFGFFDKECPVCGKYMIIKGKKIVCSDAECGHTEELSIDE